MCRSKNWGVRRLITKSFNFSSPNKGWLTKSSVKQLFTEGDLLAAWLLSDSVLRGFLDLHRCGTVRQTFCSAKPTLWDFEACTLFQKQVPSGRLFIFRYSSRLSLFYLSDVWSLSRTNSNVFRENFLLFNFVTADNTRTDLRIGLFPSGVSSKRSFTGL